LGRLLETEIGGYGLWVNKLSFNAIRLLLAPFSLFTFGQKRKFSVFFYIYGFKIWEKYKRVGEIIAEVIT
jgi:hypothetical protein